MNTIDERLKNETIKIGIYDFGQSLQNELKRLINSAMPKAQIRGYGSAGELLSDFKLPSSCPEILFLGIAPASTASSSLLPENKRAGKSLKQRKMEVFTAGQIVSLFDEKGSGLEIADYISKEKEKAGGSMISGIPLVIFVTDESCQMRDIMGAHVFACLESPLRISRVTDVLKSAVRELELYRRMDDLPADTGREEDFLVARTVTEVRRIPVSGILYVESMSRKVVVKLADEKIVYYDRISNLEEILGEGFYRIHRGYLVSLRYVIRCSRTEVEIAGGEKLPLSKYRYPGFAAAFEQYLKKQNVYI